MTPSPVSIDLTILALDSPSLTGGGPHSADLEVAVSDLRPHGRDPMDGGGHSDVWKADWARDGVCTVVALKVLRRNGTTQDALKTRFIQEVACWKDLKHENIAPLFGVCSKLHDLPVIILPWYEHGTASQYLKWNRNTEPMTIIKGIANGLAYMHEKRIVHGDIKGANVMIDQNGNARLIDFGLSHSIDGPVGPDVDVDPSEGFSVRWCAPELFHPGAVSTLSSDVYAFASTILELLTGYIPFYTLRSDLVVMMEIMKGTPPSILCSDFHRIQLRGPGETQELFVLLESCWVKAARRPNIFEVKRRLTEF